MFVVFCYFNPLNLQLTTNLQIVLSGKRRQEWFEWGRLSGLIIMIEKRKKLIPSGKRRQEWFYE